MGGSSSKFNIVQEPLNPMKVQSWRGTSQFHGRYRFGVTRPPIRNMEEEGHLEALHVKNNS